MSTVGGIRVTEPGADLAIALAIASAFRDQALPGTLAAVGEISLAGEIRPVSQAKQRVAEANRLGFSTVLDAQAGHLGEALRLAFAGARQAAAPNGPTSRNSRRATRPGQRLEVTDRANRSAHGTQCLAYGLASSRANRMRCPQPTQTPNSSPSTRPRASSISCTCRCALPSTAEACERSNARVGPSGSCSSSVATSCRDSRIDSRSAISCAIEVASVLEIPAPSAHATSSTGGRSAAPVSIRPRLQSSYRSTPFRGIILQAAG